MGKRKPPASVKTPISHSDGVKYLTMHDATGHMLAETFSGDGPLSVREAAWQLVRRTTEFGTKALRMKAAIDDQVGFGTNLRRLVRIDLGGDRVIIVDTCPQFMHDKFGVSRAADRKRAQSDAPQSVTTVRSGPRWSVRERLPGGGFQWHTIPSRSRADAENLAASLKRDGRQVEAVPMGGSQHSVIRTYPYGGEAAMKPHPGVSPTRAEVAHHESGHAVSALVLGLNLELASIVPDGDHLGHVIVAVPKHRDLDYFVRRATMTWCGLLAGERHFGVTVEDLGDDDHQQITAYGDLAALGFGEAAAFAQWTRMRAMNLLAAHWPAVTTVALALLEHDILTGDEIRRIVADGEESTPVVPIRSRRPELVAAARLASGVHSTEKERQDDHRQKGHAGRR